MPRQLAWQRLVNIDAQKDVVSETIVLDQHAISRDGLGAGRAWYDSTPSRAIKRVTVKDPDRRYFVHVGRRISKTLYLGSET